MHWILHLGKSRRIAMKTLEFLRKGLFLSQFFELENHTPLRYSHRMGIAYWYSVYGHSLIIMDTIYLFSYLLKVNLQQSFIKIRYISDVLTFISFTAHVSHIQCKSIHHLFHKRKVQCQKSMLCKDGIDLMFLYTNRRIILCLTAYLK